MARGIVHVTIVHDQTARSVADELLKPGDHQIGPQALAAFVASLGVRGGAIRVRVDSSDSVAARERATGSVNIGHAALGAADTLTIGPVTLTWVAGAPANENEVEIGANGSEDAANLAAAINAHSVLGKIVEAVADGVDVDLTYWGYGRDGELVTLATSDAAAMALSGSALELASNTDTALEDGIEYRAGL